MSTEPSRLALVTVAQMGAADAAAVARGTAGTTLMHNAGMAVVREIARRWSARPTLVLCGPGNNGGDGFVVAAELGRMGWPVRVALLGERGRLHGDAAFHAARWTGALEPAAPAAIGTAGLVVDALFGSGLNRPLAPEAAATLAEAVRRRVPIVAVDVPSGVMGDSGASVGAVASRCTVTFARKKPAHVLMPGRALCGEVTVADIGIPDEVFATLPISAYENHPSLWGDSMPRLDQAGNKYSRGHALLYGGYPVTGAARMAARAAARVGAGLTTIAVPSEAFAVYASALLSIMVRPLAGRGRFGELLSDRRFTACLIGPGAGVDDATRDSALAILRAGRPVVLDADAISVFAGRLSALGESVKGPCVMTPHEGEFARVFSASGDKLTRARAAAHESGAVLVLKGADTVIAAPDGRAIVNTHAPATLATAGSGDVLGGLILGLLAQGMDAFDAAAAGVWVHGAAAADFGPGLIAEDLPELVPAVLRRLACERASGSDRTET
ncbi:MAG TPA: NAD(P)H-hydrate dehydratase [Steroidobacteraceae bacterium]|nr:NAD(P)H-hydrate dehydratase [Steroidobacteraceae bacterium]